jgi:trigger factor
MKISRENVDEMNGLIRVSIEKADYEATVEGALKDYRRKVNMPGFRPGMVPMGLVKKMYGKAAMAEEINKILSDSLSKFIVEEKLDILGEPLPNEEQQKSIDFENDTDFEFLFDIGYSPEVKLTLDKRTKIPYFKIKVTEDLIDQQAEAYAMRFGANEPADVIEEKETVRGDIVQLDAEGNVKEGGASAEMALISIDIIKDEEIKKSFIGKKVDDVIVFDIRKAYPNNTELAYLLNIDKKDAENIEGDFRITVKEVHKFVPAVIDEDLFKKVYGEETEIKDETAFRSKISEEIALAYESSSDYKFAIDAREAIMGKVKADFPEDFLKKWLLATNKELKQEELEAEFPHFLVDLKWQIIKEKIVKENEIKVEEEEVIALAREVAAAQFRQYGMFDIPVQHLDGFAKQMLEKKEDRNRLYNKKLDDKVTEVVKSKTAQEEKEVTKEEFEKLFEK